MVCQTFASLSRLCILIGDASSTLQARPGWRSHDSRFSLQTATHASQWPQLSGHQASPRTPKCHPEVCIYLKKKGASATALARTSSCIPLPLVRVTIGTQPIELGKRQGENVFQTVWSCSGASEAQQLHQPDIPTTHTLLLDMDDDTTLGDV